MIGLDAMDLQSALKNRGHTTSEIEIMSPEEKFDEYCEWHGLIGWGPRLRGIMDDAND